MATTRRDFVKMAAGASALATISGPARAVIDATSSARRGAPGKKLLILGGTAFLGPQIVASAKARGHTLTLFNRGKTNPQLFPDIEKLRGDRDPIKDEGLKALEGRKWDAVIDTSGYVPRIVKASAALLAANVERYIFISTVSAYADSATPDADETAPLATIADPADEDYRKPLNYGPLKALCEQAAEAAMPGRIAIVRPGLIVGPGDFSDRFTYWPVRVQRGGEVLAPGKPTDPIQLIDARDLGEWLVRVGENGTTGVFNALGPDKTLTIGDLLASCKRVTGSDATFTWAGAAFLEENEVSAWGDMPVWVPSEGDSKGFGRRSNAKAIKAGLTFRPIDDTVKATLDWFKAQPPERQSKLRAGVKPEREAEVLATWHKQHDSK